MLERCPLCGTELENISDVCRFAFFCEKCEDIRFRQTLIFTCERCGRVVNRATIIVTFEEYQATPNKKIDTTCSDCLWEAQSERF